MYMSYCRFEGTRQELNACMGDVEEHLTEEAQYEVSYREIDHFKQMVFDFVGFLNDLCIIDAEVDEKALEEICEKMATSYAEDEEE